MIRHIILISIFLFSTLSHAKSWWKLNPEDAFGAWDDSYWVGFYQDQTKTWAMDVYWSGSVFVYDASTGCFEGLITAYCFDPSGGYNLVHDGSVIESGFYYR